MDYTTQAEKSIPKNPFGMKNRPILARCHRVSGQQWPFHQGVEIESLSLQEATGNNRVQELGVSLFQSILNAIGDNLHVFFKDKKDIIVILCEELLNGCLRKRRTR